MPLYLTPVYLAFLYLAFLYLIYVYLAKNLGLERIGYWLVYPVAETAY